MTLAIHGGTPVRTAGFPDRDNYDHKERDAVQRVVKDGLLSGFRGAAGPYFNGGPGVRDFERQWCERFGYEHAITVNSWTTGIIACLKAIGIKPGDEVIVPPYTMSATATAVLFCGGRVRFADIEPDTFCIDPDSVRSNLTPRTRAVIAVHLFGHPANMDALSFLCHEHGLALIEDGAQSPGVKCWDRYVGAIGHIGGFSLTQTKHIHTGEGGVIVTNDDELAEYCRAFRNHGENLGDGSAIGGNYRWTELQAALGLAQLPKLDGIIEHRQRLAELLSRYVGQVDGLTPPTVRPGCEHAYFTYPIRFDPDVIGVDRATFVKAVNAECGARVLTEGYVEPLHRKAVYGCRGQSLRTVERMHEYGLMRCRMVREPLEEDDMKDVAEAIYKVATHVGELKEAA